jgi:hypothetical protein
LKIIKIKDKAPELLRKELTKVAKDIIVGDYQPVEKETKLSRL